MKAETVDDFNYTVSLSYKEVEEQYNEYLKGRSVAAENHFWIELNWIKIAHGNLEGETNYYDMIILYDIIMIIMTILSLPNLRIKIYLISKVI